MSGEPAAGRWGALALFVSLAVSLALVLGQLSCVVLPVKTAPAAEGVVVDQLTREPLAGALVVVRFDGRYDEILPDRELIGHMESRTDAQGRFRVGPITRAGVSAWPLFKTEARVVGVLREGYRCPSPRRVPRGREVEIALAPALDVGDRRESCRPVAAERGETTDYMTAWRALFPAEENAQTRESQRQLDRLLEARAALGFGRNCEGPILDLALARGGARMAYLAAGASDSEIFLAELSAGQRPTPKLVGHTPAPTRKRLAWTNREDLVLWEPASAERRSLSPSIFSETEVEIVWTNRRHAPPAAWAKGAAPRSRNRPLEPADLNDEADALWFGRTFALERAVDPETGLALDRLAVTRRNGTSFEIALPGETCGPGGRFGRPHYRISADGRTALDLRFVDAGCHAVGIDLETGEWSRLDASAAPGVCSDTRRIPAVSLETALRGYSREVSSSIADAGADPASAFALEIAENGETIAATRDFAGEPRRVRVPRFPITTPLRRIEVATASGGAPRLVPAAVPALDPL